MVYTKNDFGVDLLINLVIYKTIELHFADSDHLRAAYDVVFRHGCGITPRANNAAPHKNRSADCLCAAAPE